MAPTTLRQLVSRAACLVGVVAVLAVFSLFPGCAVETSNTKPERWVLSNVHIEGYPTAEGLVKLAELVAAEPRLSSKLNLDLQLGGVLGNEKEALEKLRFGGIQLACTSAAPLAEFAPAVGVLSLPFLFQSSDHLWRTLAGDVGNELKAELAKAGFVALAWYDAGARSFYNRKRPIRTPADLAGLKIRVQRSEMMRDLVSALGASPVALGFKNVYTSLQTGAIDGAENNLPSYRSERHFEAAGFYSLDRHAMIPDVVLVSRDRWQELGDLEQKLLQTAAEDSADYQRDRWAEYRERATQAVTDAGSVINEISDPMEFRDRVTPVYDKHAKRFGTMVERILELGDPMDGAR